MKKLVNFIFICITVLLVIAHIINIFLPLEYEDIVEKYTKEYSVSKSLVLGIIKTESNFDKEAVSNKGAKGLMQITEETAYWCAEKMGLKQFKPETLINPETNIKMGVWYLSYLLEKTGSEDVAVISYNAGINKVNGWIKEGLIDKDIDNFDSIPYEETKNYIKKVKLYKNLYEYRTKISK